MNIYEYMYIYIICICTYLMLQELPSFTRRSSSPEFKPPGLLLVATATCLGLFWPRDPTWKVTKLQVNASWHGIAIEQIVLWTCC